METVDAIWTDYFGPPADGGGFLLRERSFSNGIKGLENEVVLILESVRSVPDVTGGAEWKALDSDQGFAGERVANVLGIKEARTNADSLKGKADDLKQTLTQVRDKIIALSNELRTLRSQFEAEEEGRGS